MKKTFLTLCFCAFTTLVSYAQYTFELSMTTTPSQTETLDNGAKVYSFPAGTDLNNLGLSCIVPQGATVSPDPQMAKIRDNQVEIFTVTYADGTRKAFPYYFTAGRWFTAIIFGDPEIDMADRDKNNATPDNLAKWARNIIGMKESGHYAFKTTSRVKPAPDLVICMGDMDKDQGDGEAISEVFNLFTAANIPFVTMIGNHDIAPDYWGSGNTDASLKALGTAGSSNKTSLDLVTNYLNTAKGYGIENVVRFTQPSGDTQPEPFTFTFKGVRFYVGQTYWFQKPYTYNTLTKGVYYAPNGIVSSLTDFVAEHKDEASVWIQHYPISCADRWWTDANEGGYSIDPTDTPDYQTAEAKRNKYMDLITQTKNPYHFSGHNHVQSINTHTYNGKTFSDYVAPYFAERGRAWMVLCHEGEGVVEVQSVPFDYNE